MGDVNPSGKLPSPSRGWRTVRSQPGRIYRQTSKDIIDIKYNEHLRGSHRYKQKKVKPLFPSATVELYHFRIWQADGRQQDHAGRRYADREGFCKNTGAREGQEVNQLYISDKKSSASSRQGTERFQKVKLAPGETKEVTFTIDKEALSFFDDTQHAWVAEPGKFEAVIAASAADEGTVPFELK